MLTLAVVVLVVRQIFEEIVSSGTEVDQVIITASTAVVVIIKVTVLHLLSLHSTNRQMGL